MDPWLNQNKKAFFQSILVFTILFSAVVLLSIFYDFTGVDVEGLLFLAAFLLCVFAAKNAYDTARGAVSSAFLKKNVGESLDFTSEELYVQLYKNSPIPYLLIDVDGQVLSANLAAARMFGVTQANVIGVNIFNRIKCEKEDHLDFLIEKFRRGVSISDEMVWVKRDDYKEEWALLSLFRFTDVHGQRIGLLTLVDITKQKRAEDAKSEFVSLASHQLRTPIAGMKWSAELLKLDNPETLTDRQHKYIDRLLISIKRMAVLVDDFLRVSRFELGTFQAEYETVALTELFEDIVSEQESRAKQKKLKVKTFYEKNLNEVVTDSNLIRMIVTNLFSNAVKYTREKGTIHIGFGRKDDSIIITVADNGMGIPAEDQDSIFLKLFRASNAVRDVPDGTGLGLYIVHQAVSVLKGNITFTTTEGIGTTFEVILPLELPNEKAKKD